MMQGDANFTRVPHDFLTQHHWLKIFCPLQYTHNVNFSTKINHMIV